MELPDAIERVSSAVIQIRSTAGSVLGTGFMVDASGWVLTADHGVAAAEDARSGLTRWSASGVSAPNVPLAPSIGRLRGQQLVDVIDNGRPYRLDIPKADSPGQWK